MHKNKLASIAMTTSKSEKYLKEQMDSLLNQTYKNIEICVSHDECGDGTVRILEEYAKKDSRVRWMYNPLAKGYIKNTENSIIMCKGDIIFLCDHDDSWDLSRVEKHMKIYVEYPYVGWVCNRVAVTEETNTKVTGYLEDKIEMYYRNKSMLENTWGTCIGGAQTSYRAGLLKKTMPIGENAPAHDSWIQLAIWPARRYFISEVLQNYRQHPNNEVGLIETDQKRYKETEQVAIQDNMRYLKSLPYQKNLALWKRGLFFCVYILKKIRNKYRVIFLRPQQ